MSQYNVRLPSDGTGKRIHSEVFVELSIKNETRGFVVGETVTAAGGFTGTIVHTHDLGGVDPHVYILMGHESALSVSVDANLQVNSSTIAQANSVGTPYYNQANMLVSGSNPFNRLEIDNKGAARTRFAEGSPQFDSFGKMQVSQQVTLAEYIHQYDTLPLDWWDETNGTGTITHDKLPAGVLLQVGTASGDYAKRTTHLYHHYQAGKSQLIEMTVQIGDTGKANVKRVWGYGDINDGVFFVLDGTTLSVMLRSSVSGSVVETVVNQSAWNIDRVNGTLGLFNSSLQIIDVSKDNIYWIDLQWLGAGRVRFGVIMQGLRITCHEFYNANLNPASYMRTGALPIHVGVANTGTSGSTSEMRFFCGTVKTEGDFSPQTKHLFKHTRSTEKVGGLIDGHVYKKRVFNYHPGRNLFTIRALEAVSSVTNRSVGVPNFISFTNQSDHHMNITARRGATIINPTWEMLHEESHFEYDDKGELDPANRGTQTGHWMIPPNESINLKLGDVFGYRKEKILLHANGSSVNDFSYTFSVYNMSPIFKITASVSFASAGAASASYGGTIHRHDGGNFITNGYASSMGVYVGNSSASVNNGYYIISSVTVSTLYLDTTASITTQNTKSSVLVQAGETGKCFAGFNIAEIR